MFQLTLDPHPFYMYMSTEHWQNEWWNLSLRLRNSHWGQSDHQTGYSFWLIHPEWCTVCALRYVHFNVILMHLRHTVTGHKTTCMVLSEDRVYSEAINYDQYESNQVLTAVFCLLAAWTNLVSFSLAFFSAFSCFFRALWMGREEKMGRR